MELLQVLLDAHLLDDPEIGLADAAAVAVIVAVVQAIKMALPVIPHRTLPLLAMLAGVGVQIVQVADNGQDVAWVSTIIAGLIVGIAASGTFNVIKDNLPGRADEA